MLREILGMCEAGPARFGPHHLGGEDAARGERVTSRAALGKGGGFGFSEFSVDVELVRRFRMQGRANGDEKKERPRKLHVPLTSSPASARRMSAAVGAQPNSAAKEPKRGP